MKIQNVEKECLAIVGLSVEFTDSEISSLSNLLTTVKDATERGAESARVAAIETGKKHKKCEEIECFIDLKSLIRIKWLLEQLTQYHEESNLFDQADYDCEMSFWAEYLRIPEQNGSAL